MINIETQEQLDIIDGRLNELENKPESIKKSNGVFYDDPTLLIPLSSRNKQAINTHVVYPVTVSIVDGATAANYDVFFTAQVSCQVISVSETHRVLGTDAGAVTLTVEKLTSGQALNAGSVILTTALSLKTTVDTPQFGVLVGSAERVLRKGDRLALKDTGTLTAVAGVSVTLIIKHI